MKQKKPNHSLAMRIIGAAFLLITLSAQVWAGFEEGEAAFVRGDYTEAHREWMPLAVEGDARAQWGVAHLYLLGLGVMQDVAVGAQWAKKSADQGYVEGLSLLADLYQRGVGVSQDLSKAMELIKLHSSGSTSILTPILRRSSLYMLASEVHDGWLP